MSLTYLSVLASHQHQDLLELHQCLEVQLGLEHREDQEILLDPSVHDQVDLCPPSHPFDHGSLSNMVIFK